jgi:flavin reductase (DIM6/NTAB) family NADH-FMN oxidoreductase RutF
MLGIPENHWYSEGFMSCSISDFKYTLSQFASGVTVVTYLKNGIGSGVTVSAFSSLSLDPPLVLICLNLSSPLIAAVQSGSGFSIHLLRANQADISNIFSINNDSRIQFLKEHSHKNGITGAPLIPGCLSILDCSLESVLEGGDHKIIVGRVEDTHYELNSELENQPLLYFNRNYRTTKDL